MLSATSRRWHVFPLPTPLILLAVAVASGPLAKVSLGAEAASSERQRKIDNIVAKWQGMYGPVDFGEKLLFECMVYLHPQPRTSFRAFGTSNLSRTITRLHQHWLERIFSGRFYESLKDLAPSGYYLNEGRTEASLLLYELVFEGKSVTVIENFNTFFVTVKPKDHISGQDVGKEAIARLLLTWTKLDYISMSEVAEGFRLSENLKFGDVFTNRTQPRISRIGDWKDHIVGFVSKEGICLMLFKADGRRAQLGFPYDFDWLNKGLYKKDGKTLLDPPRRINQRSRDPWSLGRAAGHSSERDPSLATTVRGSSGDAIPKRGSPSAVPGTGTDLSHKTGRKESPLAATPEPLPGMAHESQPPPSSGDGAWTYLVIVLGACVAGAGAWLLLRRRSSG